MIDELCLYCEYLLSEKKCKECICNYGAEFTPRNVKDGECWCFSCKRTFRGWTIPIMDNPKIGLCCDCM